MNFMKNTTAEIFPIKDVQWQSLFDKMRKYVAMQESAIRNLEKERKKLKRRDLNLKVANIDSDKKIDL